MQTMQRVGIDSDWRNYEVFYNHLQIEISWDSRIEFGYYWVLW